MSKRIGVLVATKREYQALTEIMDTYRDEQNATGLCFRIGKIGKNDLSVVMAGQGKVAAAMHTQALIDFFKPDVVFNTGASGSLTKELHIGDLVLGTEAVQHDMDMRLMGCPLGFNEDLGVLEIPLDKALAHELYEICLRHGWNAIEGRILTGDCFAGEEQKKQIKELFGGYCVEMEGSAVAQVLWLNHVRGTVIRAVSDEYEGAAFDDYDTFALSVARKAAALVKEYALQEE